MYSFSHAFHDGNNCSIYQENYSQNHYFTHIYRKASPYSADKYLLFHMPELSPIFHYSYTSFKKYLTQSYYSLTTMVDLSSPQSTKTPEDNTIASIYVTGNISYGGLVSHIPIPQRKYRLTKHSHCYNYDCHKENFHSTSFQQYFCSFLIVTAIFTTQVRLKLTLYLLC